MKKTLFAVFLTLVGLNPSTILADNNFTLISDNKRYVFNIEDLENEFEQHSFKTKFYLSKKIETFKGPLIISIIEKYFPNLNSEYLLISANDGFKKKINLGHIKKENVILATQINSKPISLEQRGPILMAVEESIATKNKHGHAANWMWFVEKIEVSQ